MSRASDLKAQLIKEGKASLPLPDDKELTRVERQAGRQRLRTALRMAAWRAHLKVELKTTDTEVTATVVGEQ